MWYAAAVENDNVFATTFSPKEEQVLRHLLKNLPHNVQFQVAEEPSQPSTELLKTLKAIFEGKNVSHSNFKTNMDHLPSYTRRAFA